MNGVIIKANDNLDFFDDKLELPGIFATHFLKKVP